MKLKKFIANKKFYGIVLALAVPIMLQNGITNFVSLLDNIMVGMVGTEEMSAVSIVNQILFVYNLCVFGALSGIGLFTSQMHGKGDKAGVEKTFALKLIVALVLGILGIALVWFFRVPLVNAFLHESPDGGDLAKTLALSEEYIAVMLIGLLPFALSQAVSSSQREIGYSVLPMVCGLVAVGVNMLFNYILIFGKLGAPAMGVAGAAIATVISRFVECALLFITGAAKRGKYYFLSLNRSSFRMEKSFLSGIIKKATPLFLNETFWAAGMSLLTAAYSTRGLSVVAAMNISTTLSNVFNVVVVSLGTAVSILMGQKLGAGRVEEAKEDVPRLAAFSVFLGIVVGILLFAASFVFPKIYNTSDEIRHLATKLIIVAACFLPVQAYLNVSYFTIRSGGKTLITFLFDSVFICLVSVPTANLFARLTPWNIVAVYAAVSALDFIKCFIGTMILRSGKWAVNMTENGDLGALSGNGTLAPASAEESGLKNGEVGGVDPQNAAATDSFSHNAGAGEAHLQSGDSFVQAGEISPESDSLPNPIQALVFDLDGTLTDTLDDLWAATNHALAACGLPLRSREEVRRFVGNGLYKLAERAVTLPLEGEGQDGLASAVKTELVSAAKTEAAAQNIEERTAKNDETALSGAAEKVKAGKEKIDAVYQEIVSYYGAHCKEKTRPYEGIDRLLSFLKSRGVKVAVVSNKADFAVKEIAADYFPGVFPVAVGEKADVPKKPAPDAVFAALKELGVSPQSAVYVGDSEVDVQTANNAKMPLFAAAWGFRGAELLKKTGATRIFATPDDLTAFLRTVL